MHHTHDGGCSINLWGHTARIFRIQHYLHVEAATIFRIELVMLLELGEQFCLPAKGVLPLGGEFSPDFTGILSFCCAFFVPSFERSVGDDSDAAASHQ